VTIALPHAETPKNILSGFAATGIWPFNRDVFEDSDFTPCDVIDRKSTHFQSDCIPSSNVSATSFTAKAVGLVPIAS
jgi:hypothetical protein